MGTHSFELNFPTAWTAGATLYILWADDNASPSPDALFELDNVVFTVPTVGVVARNVVANPGFESVNWDGWFPFGPATISTQTNQVHSGSYTALVENRSATWMGIDQEDNRTTQEKRTCVSW